ncbi:hypothetical protein BDQ17DRAFT_1374370 [Cyathus striatus]|nr:hypothetical protein BDQ17DRAFT_1374370 [Cyathus striatus]
MSSALASITIGTIIASMLYGATCVQTFVYFRTSNSDRTWTKIATTNRLFRLLGTIHFVCITDLIYYYLVKNFGNLEAFLVMTCNVFIAGALCIILARSRSGVKRAVELTTFIVVGTFKHFIVGKTNDIVQTKIRSELYIGLSHWLVVGNVYTNSLLASLNIRTTFRDTDVEFLSGASFSINELTRTLPRPGTSGHWLSTASDRSESRQLEEIRD